MKTENLNKFEDPYFEIPHEWWNSYEEFLEQCSFKKNNIIKHAHKNERHLYLITKGSSGHFVYRDGHDICIDLCYEGDFTGDYYSLLLQNNLLDQNMKNSPIPNQISLYSPIYVMALEPIEAMALSMDNLLKLYQQPDHGQRIARMVAEILFLQKQTQQIDLLTLTAEQRYLKLLEKQPNILKRTANKHIASFLGITPESFSRIRKKIVL
jgi:CRP-like cAMP-binding protein